MLQIEAPGAFRAVFRRILQRAEAKVRSQDQEKGKASRGRPRSAASEERLAAYLEISRDTIRHLSSDKPRKIDLSTFRHLERIAGRHRDALRRAVLSDRTETHLDMAAGARHRLLEEPEAERGLSRAAARRLRELVRNARSRSLSRLIDALERALIDGGHSDRRRIDVYRAILAPLNRFYTSGGVERGVDDLDDRELGRFLVYGLRRELILLRRSCDEVRAQKADPARVYEQPEFVGEAAARSWNFLDESPDVEKGFFGPGPE
jgi:hypothetical protein